MLRADWTIGRKRFPRHQPSATQHIIIAPLAVAPLNLLTSSLLTPTYLSYIPIISRKLSIHAGVLAA